MLLKHPSSNNKKVTAKNIWRSADSNCQMIEEAVGS